MGRQRTIHDEDALVINLLTWCGAHMEPLGHEPLEALKAEGFDLATYLKIRAEKALYHDQSMPGEADMIRRPYGATAAVD